MKIGKKYFLGVGLFLISVFIITGCANKGGSIQGDSINGGKGIFQVSLPDGTTKKITSEVLRKLPLTSISVEGKVEEGPSLKEILDWAGVKDIKQVKITGSSGSITLTSKQVTPQTILDFTNKGTMKFAAVDVPKSKWIKDIIEIKVD